MLLFFFFLRKRESDPTTQDHNWAIHIHLIHIHIWAASEKKKNKNIKMLKMAGPYLGTQEMNGVERDLWKWIEVVVRQNQTRKQHVISWQSCVYIKSIDPSNGVTIVQLLGSIRMTDKIKTIEASQIKNSQIGKERKPFSG